MTKEEALSKLDAAWGMLYEIEALIAAVACEYTEAAITGDVCGVVFDELAAMQDALRS